MSDLEERIRALSPHARQRLLNRLEDKRTESTIGIPHISRDRSDFPLSFAQERLWFLDQLSPGNTFYNLAFAQRIPAAVSREALERALSELVRRHEALRTAFTVVDAEPVQRILESVPLNLTFEDFTTLGLQARESRIKQFAKEMAEFPFDLSKAPLFRATLIRIDAFESVFLFVIHHIIADAWSLEIIFRDLSALYTYEVSGRQPSMSEQKIQYVDYTVWQRAEFEKGALEEQLAFWTRALDNLPTLDLPIDHVRPAIQQFRGSYLEIALHNETVMALRDLGKETDTTLFMILLSAFYVLLNRYCQQDDLVVGMPVANRTHTELEEIVGFFINNLVLRMDVSGNPSFRELLKRVRKMTLDAYNHQDLPFSRLVAALNPQHDLSRNPLFQVSFQLVASSQGGSTNTTKGDWNRSLSIERSTTIYDLTFNLWDTGTDIRGVIEYSSQLFARETVQAMSEHYLNLLSSTLANPDEAIRSLPILSENEQQQLLFEWNSTNGSIPSDVKVHTLFSRQAAITPEDPALCKGVETISYEELARRANVFARRIQAVDPRIRRNIGLLVEPSFDMVSAVLGILESGNAFVPLDITVPPARLLYMVEDASIELVVTTEALAPLLVGSGVHLLLLDTDAPDKVSTDASVDIEISPTDCAYVIFTSGSTGRPKGVMVSHRSVTNYLEWARHMYPVESGIGAPLTSPISSDLSITSLFLPLISGKAVVFLEGENLIESLACAMRDGPTFSFVKLTPSHLIALRNLSVDRRPPTGTHALILGGEPLRGEDLEPWRDTAPDMPIFNEYGPTEATVGCSVYELKAREVRSGPVPIGRPIANSRLYVLDSNGAPAGTGVPGELYIGGIGVAEGYVAAPHATANSFLPDHITHRPGERLYRTGDLVRLRADGELQFLGRVDRQLKIRGYRIEPGDVETAMRQYDGVADAVVLASEFGLHDKRLVACVVPTPDQNVSELIANLDRFLQTKLPSYMIPGRIIPIESIPLTSSGKADARTLVELTQGQPPVSRGSEQRTLPQTALQEIVARIFSDVLKIDEIGIHDDFFAHLGGDSLLATRVVSRVREYLQAELPLRALFESPTVETLTAILQSNSSDIERLEITTALVLEVLDTSDEQVERELTNDRENPDQGRT